MDNSSSSSISESSSKLPVIEQQNQSIQSQNNNNQSVQRGKKIRSYSNHQCQKHKILCGQCYEFTDQKEKYGENYQPFLEKIGTYKLPLPNENQENNEQTAIIKGITEESLDDWIAQSLNRPVVSFLDPYKKFQVPESMLNQFKQRYRKYYQENPDKTNAKKRLYFEKPDINDTKPHYMLPIGEKQREREKDITIGQQQLRPRSLPGISIAKRETNQLKNRGLNIPEYNYNENQNSGYQSQQSTNQNQFSTNSPLKPKNNLDQNFYQSQNYDSIYNSIQSMPNQNNSNHLISNNQILNRHQKLPQLHNQMSFNQYKLAKMKIDSSKKLTNHLLNSRRLSRTSSQYTQEININPDININNENKNNQDFNQNSQFQQQSVQYNSIQNDSLIENEEKPVKIQIYKLLNINDKTVPFSRGVQINKNKNKSQELNLHTEFTQTSEPLGDKSTLKEVEFNYWRAIRRILNNKQTEAIKLLKENLQNYPEHFNSIFNLANLYERAQKFQLSQRWYKIALKFNQQTDECKFGLALSYYKQEKYREALDLVENYAYPVKYENKHAVYLKIVCNKRLGNIEQSDEDFKQFIQLTCPKNYQLLMHFMFAIIFANLRGLEIKFSPLVYCDFISLTMNVADIYYNPDLKISLKNQQVFMDKLSKLNFFKRFLRSDLQQFLPLFMKNLKYFNKNDIIHTQKDKVYIITSGNILIWDCIKGYDEPTIISYHHEGDILGLPELDNYLCEKPDVFLQVSTDQLQYIEMDITDFYKLWDLQKKNTQNLENYNFISKAPIFNNVSQLTLHKLAFEFMVNQDFLANQTIFNEGSALQKEHIQYIKVVKKKELTKEEKQALKAKLKKKKLQQSENQQENTEEKDKTADFQKQIVNGFYMIKQGSAELQTPTGWLDCILREQDFMGENLLFNTESITRYGIIVAKSSPCKCIFLKKHYFEEINKIDREIMKQNIYQQPKYIKLIDQIKQKKLLDKNI